MATLQELVPVGKQFVSIGRTIGEGDFTLLTNLTWTTSNIHSNREYMKQTQFGERILAGPCVLACVVGLASTSGVMQQLNQNGLRTVALLGFEGVRFSAPVKPGDTLTVHSQILGLRPSGKNSKRAVAQIRDVAFNQDGQEVMSATRFSLIELTA